MKTIVFKVSYSGGKKFERTFEFNETQTLADLHDAIMKELKWDDDHLYSFFLDNKVWSKNKDSEYTRPDQEDELEAKSADISLNKLGFKLGQKFAYIFDFGDEHTFRIQVKNIGKAIAGQKYPLIIEATGKHFEQYQETEE